MRSYDEFASDFMEALKRQMPEAELTKHEVQKVNGNKVGITVKYPDSPVAPTVYIDDMYKGYLEHGMSVWECAKDTSEFLESIRPDAPKIEDFISLKDGHKLYASVINKEMNQELLEVSPHRDIPDTDLSMVARYRIDDNSSFLVNNSNFSYLGMKSTDEVMDMAIANTSREQFYCVGMNQLLLDMMIEDGAPEEAIEEMKEECKGKEGLYVVTNKDKYEGAVAIGLPEVMKQAVSDIGEEKAYILPSSRHEILLMPESIGEKMSVSEIQNMIQDVNITQVDQRDLLSNKAYFWDGSKVCLAEQMEKGVASAKSRGMNLGKDKAVIK